MIELKDIDKSFRLRKGRPLRSKALSKKVLKGVSFTAHPGEIYGLLGPNGAGKTTTLRIIATLLKADSGFIRVNGMDPKVKGREIRDSIGFLTGDMKLSGNLSPREMLRFFADLNHLDSAVTSSRIDELITYLTMEEFIDKPIEKLSAGMKQKTSIAVSLVHDPDIIIFDEPTSNLDVLAVKVVVDFLLDAVKQGKTVILSTHVLSEAEKLCDRIGIILDGDLIINGTKKEILDSYHLGTLDELFFTLARERGLAV